MKHPFVLGLTGSIGMGKSTTAQMFLKEGVPVWDADAAVHRLYEPGAAGAIAVAQLCPEGVVAGRVDRSRLRDWITQSPRRLKDLEAEIHPLVAADRVAFVASSGAAIVVLDIPLLFETGADAICDAVVVVTVDPKLQEHRVLSRPNMSEAGFQAILLRQMPDTEKRARADYVIETRSIEGARRQVQDVLRDIRGKTSA